MSDTDCRSELVVRERRGELAPSEKGALELHLAACETCRLSRRLGRDFDECAALEGGDGARISALSELARRFAGGGSQAREQRADSPARSRPRWARRTLALAAALPLLVAAVASAAYGVYQAQTSGAGVPAAAPALPAQPVAAAKKSPAPRAPVAHAPPAPPEPAPAEPEPTRAEKPAVRRTDSAAERFERANTARRSGDLARAITLYRELQRDFPASPEAAAAELRLGNLLLERGRADGALEQFDRHLRRSGALIPEALYGRGRALAALGARESERQTWTRMLRDYSGSPYAAHARRRLESLARNAAGAN